MPRFWPNQFYKFLSGMVLIGLCLPSFSQTAPLQSSEKTEYPGIIQTFEKLIQIDSDKFKKRSEILIKNNRLFGLNDSIANLELEPDFLNSIILHSESGYIKLASTSKCRFYEAILADLLKSAEGKISNVLMTYLEKDIRQSAVISKKDFLTKVVNSECPETQKTISAFQIKTIGATLKETAFDVPSGIDQCRNIHINWLNNPKTPFLCQIHEYIKETKLGLGNPKDLQQRRVISKILEEKQTPVQKEYIDNLCRHLDDEDLFCEEFLNVSFWTKIANGYENKIFVDDICQFALNTPTLTSSQYNVCLARIKKEKDLCLYPAGRNHGLRPQPDCDQLSTALNYSSLKVDYKDCPGNSDQMIATNMGRIINHFSTDLPKPVQGPCSTISAAETFIFNKKFDNESNWKLEACYHDKINDKEVCTKTFFGKYANEPESYASVVANILKNTQGAHAGLTCELVDSSDYNPLLLQYKSGCYIIFDRANCFISECKHKILYNDKLMSFIKIKNQATITYFPLNIRDERYSQHYLLLKDFKKVGKPMTTVNGMSNYFKKSKNGIIHGVGCAEDILPTFFKTTTLNQCTPLPFIINGIIKDQDKVVFVTRTAADTLQAPRLISWSIIYSAVRAYQRIHPLKVWTMYGLD